MANRDVVKGRSEAINKTITEIMKFLEDDGERPGGRGADLRGFLRQKLADLAEHSWKRGFRRGHIEAHKESVDKGKVPTKLRYEARRVFFKGQKRLVRVTSKIKRETSTAGRKGSEDETESSVFQQRIEMIRVSMAAPLLTFSLLGAVPVPIAQQESLADASRSPGREGTEG